MENKRIEMLERRIESIDERIKRFEDRNAPEHVIERFKDMKKRYVEELDVFKANEAN